MDNTTQSVWNRTGRVWGVADGVSYQGNYQTYNTNWRGKVAPRVYNKVNSLCRFAASGTTCK